MLLPINHTNAMPRDVVFHLIPIPPSITLIRFKPIHLPHKRNVTGHVIPSEIELNSHYTVPLLILTLLTLRTKLSHF